MIKKMLLTAMFSLSVASCEEPAHPVKFTVQVVDDKKLPIVDAEVGTSTFVRWQQGEAFGQDIWEGPSKQRTDTKGCVTFEYLSKRGEVGIWVDPGVGYYSSNWPNYRFQEVIAGRWTPENPTIPYVLKKKKNPIPLCAKNLTEGLAVPVIGERCGYDFEVGDWIAPHGKGKNLDISFKVTLEKKQDGDFFSTVEVTFPKEKDGLIYFEQNRHEGSELISDHDAPLEGYKPSKLMKRFKEDGKITSEMNPEKGNYYLRVRTSIDDKGNIQSANYAKIYGDFMYFTYYFNPTPNDRNLEFDLKRNLHKGQDVTNP